MALKKAADGWTRLTLGIPLFSLVRSHANRKYGLGYLEDPLPCGYHWAPLQAGIGHWGSDSERLKECHRRHPAKPGVPKFDEVG